MISDSEDVLERLCRLCAKPNITGIEKYIYDTKDDQFTDLDIELDLAELINTFLPIKVTRTDPLPKQICEMCTEKLKATHEFMVNCVAAEQELRTLCEQHKFSVPVMKEETKLIRDKSEDSAVSTIDLTKMLTSTETNNEGASIDYENVCCPLCHEGKMVIGEDDFGVVRDEETKSDAKREFIEAKSLEEVLYARHRRANAGLDESDSDASMEPITDSTEIKLTSGHDITTDDQKLPVKAEIPDRKNLVAQKNAQTYDKLNDDDVVMYDDEDDEDYEDGVDLSAKRKKSGRGRGRGRGRGGFRGRGRNNRAQKGHQEEPALEESQENTATTHYDETIMWIEGDENQSMPLVQCLICNRWLPGFEACLQHSVANHIDENDESVTCPRCPLNDLHSIEQLVGHFQIHVTTKEGPLKAQSPFSTLRYSCTLCRKPSSWMLNLLLHPCTGVDSDSNTCSTCNTTFNSRLRYAFHMQFHAEETMILECDVCGQGFSTDDELFDHVTLAHLEDTLSCGECGMKFQSEPELALHALQHSLNQSSPSTCLDCGQVCQDMQTFREHRATHMAVRPYYCDHCGRSFSRHTRFKQHFVSHLFEEAMECWECTDCYQVHCNQEQAILHNQSKGHNVKITLLSEVYRCEYCDICYSQPKALSSHRLTHKQRDRPYQCDACSEDFQTSSDYTIHKSSFHGDDSLVPQPGDFTIPKYFVCGDCSFSSPHWSFLLTHRKMRHSAVSTIVTCRLCPKMFHNHWELLQHQRAIHEGNVNRSSIRKKSLECELCGVRYMYQHTLDFHMEKKHPPEGEVTTGDERFQCEECGKVFKYQTSLGLHQKMHLGQKNFFCDLCNKGFVTRMTLRVHIKRSHEGVKSHKCEYCDKAFFHRVTRDDHMRIHTGEKPFQCTYCSVRFRLKSMLTDHIKIHNDDRPYACDVCGSRFRRMVHMKQHRMLHTGEKPFQCFVCQKAFHLKQELKRHIKVKHQAHLDEDHVDEEEDDFIYAV